ncbi:MAG: aminotransferase class V-fold PLP-dependent enzyme [Deltaproteobacteria bacterium]|nr:aminotransferase class V-fold PLP-dependent enzyme [Deltaproteobacteria bacterium]
MRTSDAGHAGREIIAYLKAADSMAADQRMHLYGGGAVAELEEKLRRHYHKKYALCVSNATMGLLAVGLAAGLKGDDFITTPYTYGATVAGWLHLGNSPVFADIEADTLALDCESVKKAISKNTRAVLAVDIHGTPHDMKGLRKIADEYGLLYVSDSAQSFGGSRDGLPAGSVADVFVVSFTAGKPLFAGEGAAILTDDPALYEKLIWFTQHPLRQRRDIGLRLDNEFALNARLHPLAAVWANAVFEGSLERLKARQKRCFDIIKALNEIGLTENVDFASRGIVPTFFSLTAAWKSGKAQGDLLTRRLREYGFRMNVDHSPVRLLYRQPAFMGQYGSALGENTRRCRQAERQSRCRFCLIEEE